LGKLFSPPIVKSAADRH